MHYQLKGNYFNNQFHPFSKEDFHRSDRIIKRTCPANTELMLWELPIMYQQIEETIASAQEGFLTWKKTPIEKRVSCLKKYQKNVQSIEEKLALAIALETGKPLWETKTEAKSVIQRVDLVIEHCLSRLTTKEFPQLSPNTNGAIQYRPLGICLIISPFNFPCHLANTQILNSLIAGNSIILKPSEKTCYSGQLLIEALANADFPNGVINLLQGNGELASRLVQEKLTKGIFFTGSKDTGLKIMKQCHQNLSKLVSLELGGKNSTIVDKNCQMDFATTELLKAAFMTSGQRCTSTARAIVHQDIIEEFIKKFFDLTEKIIIDHPVEYETVPFMGPLIDEQAFNNYFSFMNLAKRERIETLKEGVPLELNHKGFYVSPSIHLAKNFNPQSVFLSQELFGPNITVIPYNSPEQAIEIANSSEYGLVNSVFTQDKDFYLQCRQELESGMINWNRSTCGANYHLPFGGTKNSGNYRPAAISTIESCIYPVSNLEVEKQYMDKNIVGLRD